MPTPHPVEIELKLALPPSQVPAFLKRMARRRTLQGTGSAPVRQALLTRYYDTPEFALSARGVALRVRRVGRRWLQTLKTEGERQGGLSRRVEFEMPVSRAAPDWNRFPSEARAFVPEALRAQLVPVFETRFHRTTWLIAGKGGAQIEVALDVGEAVARQDASTGERNQPICEIELELKSGRPDALFALALDWAAVFDCLPFDLSKAERGVRLAHGVETGPLRPVPLALNHSMSVEDGFAAIVQACLAQFQANLPGVLGSVSLAGEAANAMPTPINDVEYVHQARVALRRLRAALRLFRAACVLPSGLRDKLRALAATLGPARDWDVLCGETLPEIAPHYADSDGWQQGLAALQAHRAAEREAMRYALLAARPGAWLLAMQRWLLRHGWRAVPEAARVAQLSPLDAWSCRLLHNGHRAIVRGAREFATLTPARRHALRIAIKRQRYAAEFFQTLFEGKRQVRYLAALHDAQDSLGRANDALVAARLLTAVRGEASPMGSFALGWLAAKQAEATEDDGAGSIRAFLKSKPCW